MEDKEHTADYTTDTWLSLLGLMSPLECLVTVDHSQLWRKHVAWSKPDGKDLINYTAQRFSSSMVFMSLILASEMNVLFNSSTITSEIRSEMINGNYYSVKHWIGFVILFSACVTVIALVSTFTAWGMISSIGDKNAHCLLRSSIGQLVTSLPSNYVVLSLYLFLVWLVLFIIELTKGPMQILLIVVVMLLFFQTVVSLSAFGRLIIHTGAMGSRPVLDPTLEKALLPSGLHASLLIMATDRKRKQTGVLSMYRSPSRKSRVDSAAVSQESYSASVRDDTATSFFRHISSSSSEISSFVKKKKALSRQPSPPLDDDIENVLQQSQSEEYWPALTSTCSSTVESHQHSITASEEAAITAAAQAITFGKGETPRSDGSISSCASNQPEKQRLLSGQVPAYGLQHSPSGLSIENDMEGSHPSMVSFPRASILNSSVRGCDLRKLVEDCCSIKSETSPTNQNDNSRTPIRSNGAGSVEKVRFTFGSSATPDSSKLEKQGSRRSIFRKSQIFSRRSLLEGFRQASTRLSIEEEWNDEADIRAYYNQAPPAQVIFDNDLADETEPDREDEDCRLDQADVRMPHPSILNKTRRLKSLRRLASGSSADELRVDSGLSRGGRIGSRGVEPTK